MKSQLPDRQLLVTQDFKKCRDPRQNLPGTPTPKWPCRSPNSNSEGASSIFAVAHHRGHFLLLACSLHRTLLYQGLSKRTESSHVEWWKRHPTKRKAILVIDVRIFTIVTIQTCLNPGEGRQ